MTLEVIEEITPIIVQNDNVEEFNYLTKQKKIHF